MVIEYETISNKYNIIYNNKYNNKKVGEDQPQQGGGGGQTMLCVPHQKKIGLMGAGNWYALLNSQFRCILDIFELPIEGYISYQKMTDNNSEFW